MALHFQRKKFLVCPPRLLISMHCTSWGFFDCMVFWRSIFSVFSSDCCFDFSSTILSTFVVGRGQGMRRCDSKIAIHDCLPYRQRDVVLK
jgi:hypothetical protein